MTGLLLFVLMAVFVSIFLVLNHKKDYLSLKSIVTHNVVITLVAIIMAILVFLFGQNSPTQSHGLLLISFLVFGVIHLWVLHSIYSAEIKFFFLVESLFTVGLLFTSSFIIFLMSLIDLLHPSHVFDRLYRSPVSFAIPVFAYFTFQSFKLIPKFVVFWSFDKDRRVEEPEVYDPGSWRIEFKMRFFKSVLIPCVYPSRYKLADAIHHTIVVEHEKFLLEEEQSYDNVFAGEFIIFKKNEVGESVYLNPNRSIAENGITNKETILIERTSNSQ